MFKICKDCGVSLPFEKFPKKTTRPGQKQRYKPRCYKCDYQHSKSFRKVDITLQKTENFPPDHKRCPKCQQILHISNFHPGCKNPTKLSHYDWRCKKCASEFYKQRRSEGYTRPSNGLLEHRLMENKWKKAKDGFVKHGGKLLPFTIRVEDIRNIIKKQTTDCLRCPLTNVQIIDEKNSLLRPSIDRIDNRLGYIPENIRIVPLVYNLCRNKWSDISTLKFICKIFKPEILDWNNFICDENHQRSYHTKDKIYTNPGSKVQYINSLTEDDLHKILVSQMRDNILYCASTGVALNQENGPFYPSLDRIDNNKGYELGNVRYVARAFNLARNKSSDEDVLKALETIKKSCMIGDLYRFGNILGFADEWLDKEIIFSNLIKHQQPIVIIRPQKCKIEIIKNRFASDFYDKFHYIGGCDAKYNIGVYFNNTLVACISINRPSRLGSGDWELTRMACDFNIRIHGIWSFLLNWIKKNKLITGELITFSDKRIFTGDVYNKMGFKKNCDVAPSYYWVKDGIRIHRSTLRMTDEEKKLNISELDLRSSQGYTKVWDLGKTKWSCLI